MMRKIVVGVVGFCFALAFAFTAYAQQGTTEHKDNNGDQRVEHGKRGNGPGEMRHRALQEKMEMYRKQEEVLHQQVRVEEAKLKELREKLHAMREQHRQDIEAERAKMEGDREQRREEHQNQGTDKPVPVPPAGAPAGNHTAH